MIAVVDVELIEFCCARAHIKVGCKLMTSKKLRIHDLCCNILFESGKYGHDVKHRRSGGSRSEFEQ